VTPLLSVEDVSKSFGGLRAVARASFSVVAGSMTALIGPNGAGKTTMFDLISGFAAADGGAIRFDGRRIEGLRPDRIVRSGLVRTFQLTRVFAGMTVIENMLLANPDQPGEHLPGLIAKARRARIEERAARARAEDLLARFGLSAKAGDYAGTLSGGQRKLLEAARALMTNPKLVLLDEPMAGINPTLGHRLLDHLEGLRRESGTTFLFVEHDMDVVMSRADRVVVMARGGVIADGPPEAVRADPRVLDAYLGGSPAGAAS
jgi:ABC-type branched-subunit amino acid transport system ATPase component